MSADLDEATLRAALRGFGGFGPYYDREGRRVDLARWMALTSDREYRRVALDDLGELGAVSTVLLGLDHRSRPGPPLIFETLVRGGPCDGYLERYSTLDQAQRGHGLVVQMVQAQAMTI